MDGLDGYGFTRNMSKKGSSLDNSACDRYFDRMKNDMFYVRDFKMVSMEMFMKTIDEYINW